MLDRIGIYERFKSRYPAPRHADLARLLHVSPQAVFIWKYGGQQVPWQRLKTLVNEQDIRWDWLLEGHAPIYHRGIKRDPDQPFDRHGINQRFLSLFPDMSQAKLGKELGINQTTVFKWQHDMAQVPWERLQYAVDTKGVTWHWLIEGEG